jgi:hypothetical protein
MGALMFYFAVASVLPIQPNGLPVAPFDVTVGQQVVDLREPIIARTPGVRMVLFTRGGTPAEFEASHPTGSVTVHLRDASGHEIALTHTGYIYYRGYSGLELTEQTAASRNQLFGHFKLEAQVPMQNVRVVWLDRLARRVEDIRPLL